MDINKENTIVLNKFNDLNHIEFFSNPLLISDNKEYINNLLNSSKRTLYIGQETNSWVSGIKAPCDILQNEYLKFLENGATNTEFWKFIKEVLSIDDDLSQHVIWSNSLLAGKKDGLGCPLHYEELKDISIRYLTFLYDYFKPTMTIIVAGPTNPYYEVITKFLKAINVSINDYPRLNNPVVIEKDVYWTYHPQYLKRKRLTNNVISKINESF